MLEGDIEYAMDAFSVIEDMVMEYKDRGVSYREAASDFATVVFMRSFMIPDPGARQYDALNYTATFNLLWGADV